MGKAQTSHTVWNDKEKIFADLSDQLSDPFIIEFAMDAIVTALIFGELELKRVHIEEDDGKYSVGDSVIMFRRSKVRMTKHEWCILLGEELKLHLKTFETSDFTTTNFRTYESAKDS